MTVRGDFVSTGPGVQAGRTDAHLRARRLSVAALATCLASLTACGGRQPPPSGIPGPLPPVPQPVAPATPSTWPIAAPSDPATFVLVTRATVNTSADTLTRTDTLQTRVRVRAVPRGAALDITVDSYAVVPRQGTALTLDQPARVLGRFQPGGAISFESPGAPACGSLPAIAIESTRDLWIAWPATAQIGDRWSDSTTVAACRDGVPLAVTLTRNYRVAAVEGDGDTAILMVHRTSAVSVTGAGAIRGVPAVITGTGNGTATFALSAALGWLADGHAASTLRLEVQTGERTQRVLQSLETELRRLGSGGRD